jgi:NADH:ubiquinone oxidoreductase subunit 4 (subunit M)
MGFPGSCNFIGELLVLYGLFQQNIISATGIILSAVYSI